MQEGEAARALDALRSEHFRRIARAHDAVRTAAPTYFPPRKTLVGRQGAPVLPKWAANPQMFCKRLVSVLAEAASPISDAGITVDQLRTLYDPERHDLNLSKYRKQCHDAVREQFIRLLEAPSSDTIRKEVEANLVAVRAAMQGDDRFFLEYFDALANRILEIPFRAPCREDPATLFEASDHLTKHSALARFLNVHGREWYLGGRTRPFRTFNVRAVSSPTRGHAALYRLGDLLAAFDRLDGRQFPDRDLTPEFKSQLVLPPKPRDRRRTTTKKSEPRK
jgi:hypothetical protein